MNLSPRPPLGTECLHQDFSQESKDIPEKDVPQGSKESVPSPKNTSVFSLHVYFNES